MKSPFESIKDPKKSPEAATIHNDKPEFDFLVEKTMRKAEMALTDLTTITRAKAAGVREKILAGDNIDKQREIAHSLMKYNPNLVPDYLKEDEEGSSAYIIALALVLDQPPYNI